MIFQSSLLASDLSACSENSDYLKKIVVLSQNTIQEITHKEDRFSELLNACQNDKNLYQLYRTRAEFYAELAKVKVDFWQNAGNDYASSADLLPDSNIKSELILLSLQSYISAKDLIQAAKATETWLSNRSSKRGESVAGNLAKKLLVVANEHLSRGDSCAADVGAVAAKNLFENARQAKPVRIREIREQAAKLRAENPEIHGTDILCALAAESTRGDRNISLEPYVPVHINFKFDSAKLTEHGEKQVHALAYALMDYNYQAFKITLVGHADKTGEKAYNLDLSYRRAKIVNQFLMDKYPNLVDRLKSVDGCGWYEPFSETRNDLNRRVEVLLTMMDQPRKADCDGHQSYLLAKH